MYARVYIYTYTHTYIYIYAIMYTCRSVCVYEQYLCIYLCIYYSRRQIEKNEMDRACSTYGRGVYRDLVGKPEGMRPLVKCNRRW